MVVYMALYCSDSWGSSLRTISIHSTRQGAKNSIKKHKKEIKNKFIIQKEERKKIKIPDIGFKWNNDKWWGVSKMEVLP